MASDKIQIAAGRGANRIVFEFDRAWWNAQTPDVQEQTVRQAVTMQTAPAREERASMTSGEHFLDRT